MDTAMKLARQRMRVFAMCCSPINANSHHDATCGGQTLLGLVGASTMCSFVHRKGYGRPKCSLGWFLIVVYTWSLKECPVSP